MKRFTDTEIWGEDWFLELDSDTQRFWLYLKDKCDHAGVWKPNIKIFNSLLGCKINLQEAFEKLTTDKERIKILENGYWFIPGFFVFQYGPAMNLSNTVHKSIYKIYNNLNIEINETSIKGLKEVREGSKRGQGEGSQGLKDKDKDKDQDKDKEKDSLE